MPLDPFHADRRLLSHELRSWASHESKSLTTEADLRAMIGDAQPASKRPPLGLIASLGCKLIVWSGRAFWLD